MAVVVPRVPSKAKLDLLRDARPMVARLRDVFGVRGAAALIDIDPGNLTRYLCGTRRLNSETTRRAIDLDHVLARASQLFVGRTALDWLLSHSATFGGARRLDVLASAGAAPLLEELERIASGGYP